MKQILKLTAIALVTALFTGCGLFEKLIEEETPTKTKMEGIWEMTEVLDISGSDSTDITDELNFPVTVFDLQSDETVISTAGPTAMYMVYGNNNYTNIASKIDQVFNYASFETTNGEWYIDGGIVDRFTLVMKLEGLPGQETLTTLLGLLGIGNDYLDLVIYHRFLDIRVEFDPFDDDVMYWTLDRNDGTWAEYFTRDKYGREVDWIGVTTDSFSHCRIKMIKKQKSIKEIVEERK